MAISRIVTWSSSQVLTASDLNGEINNIINNALSLVSPWTGNMAAGGYRLIGLALGTVSDPTLQFTGDTNTGIYSSAADTVDIAAGAVRVASFATATSGVNYLLFTPAATGAAPSLDVEGSDTNIGLIIGTKGSGTLTLQGGATNRIRLDNAYQLTLLQATANYTLAWNDPSAARTLTIPDPGASDTFAFLAATQVFTNKTLTTPTIASTGWANANHAHAASNSGGTLDGSVIAAGTVALARGGTGASLTDPNADRLMFWDDSAGAIDFLTAGSGLTISGTTMTAAGVTTAVVTSDVTVNNSTTLANATGLSFTVSASTTYYIVGFVAHNSSAVANIKFSWSLPSGTYTRIGSLVAVGDSISQTRIQYAANVASGTTFSVAGTAGVQGNIWGFLLQIGGTGGTAQFQFAQDTAEVSNTLVLEDSFMLMWT